MKKHFIQLASAALALLMLASMLASCKEEQGTDPKTDPETTVTTEAETESFSETVTDQAPETEKQQSETEIESKTETETVSDETETAPEVFSVPESDAILHFSMAVGKTNIRKIFTGFNQSRVIPYKLEDGREVIKLSTITANANDPYAVFDFPKLLELNGRAAEDMRAEEFPHILFRVKVEEATSSGFQMFYCTDEITKATTGYSASALFDPTDPGWQFIYFNLENSNYIGTINSFRLDYFSSAAEVNESMIISDMILTKTEEDALQIMGLVLSEEYYETNSPELVESYEEVTALPEDAVLDRYDLNTVMTSLWEGPIVYNEPVMFVGKDDVAPLMYRADRVFSVRSFDLKTEYKEGVDYIVTEEGKLKLTENTSIPVMLLEEYYPDSDDGSGVAYGSRLGEDRPYVRRSEHMYKRQVLVTYSHTEGWTGYKPRDCSDKYPITNAKLRNGEACKLLFYGDSITEGASSSQFFEHEPYQPKWSQLVCDYLTSRFENSNIEHINTGLGGKGISWGIENMQEQIIDYAPDLVVIAFGMNDGAVSGLSHARSLEKIVLAVKEALPDTEIAIIATMLPNEESNYWKNQHTFEEMYFRYFSSRYPDISIVRMSTVHKELINAKRYYHLTGNNVNHPNDFLIRAYAQAVVRTIAGDCEE